MRFLWFTDAHVADTPPAMRTEGYTEDIFQKLEEVAQLGSDEKVDAALFGGDWFNSKLAARVSHNLVNKSLRLLDKFPCPIYWIVGSHDVPYGRLDLLYKRPIGTLLRHPNVRYLEDYTSILDGEVRIRLFPVSDAYNNTTDEVVAALKEQRSRADEHSAKALEHVPNYDIALLHQPVVREGSYPFPVVQSADLTGLADMVLYGHMHNYEGVWEQRVGDGLPTLFVNTGAISRGSLDEKTLSRIPTVLVFDVLKMPNGPVGAAYREIPLQSAKSAEAVFRLAEKQEKLDREADIEALLTSVKETGFAAFSSTSAIDKIKAMTTESDDAYVLGHFDAVKTVAIEILEQLGG